MFSLKHRIVTTLSSVLFLGFLCTSAANAQSNGMRTDADPSIQMEPRAEAEPLPVEPSDPSIFRDDDTQASSNSELNDIGTAPLPTAVVEYQPPAPELPLQEVITAESEAIREAAHRTTNAEGEYVTAEIVPAALLSGPGYTLAPNVAVRGYMLQFTLATEFGDIAAESREMLPIRIDEVAAIERLDDTGLTEAAAKQAKKRSKRVWTGIKRIFTKPKETVEALPQGIAFMVKRRAKKLGQSATRLYDESKDRLSDDEEERAGPFTAARQPEAPSDDDESSLERESKRAGKSLVKQELGYAGIRRFIAREVSVDPYSSNPVLREKLDALAWSATGSNVAFKLVMGTLGAATAGVLPKLLQVDEIVWEETPASISEMNRLRLNELGCSPPLTRRFVRNGAFSPTLETALVNDLEALKLSRGCNDVLALAIDAEVEIEARFVVNSLRLLRAAPLPGRVGYGPGECEIEALGGGLGAHCLDELLVPVPVDALIWDADMAAFLDADDVRGAPDRTFLLTGFANAEARRQLTDRGFAIIERAPLQ